MNYKNELYLKHQINCFLNFFFTIYKTELRKSKETTHYKWKVRTEYVRDMSCEDVYII